MAGYWLASQSVGQDLAKGQDSRIAGRLQALSLDKAYVGRRAFYINTYLGIPTGPRDSRTQITLWNYLQLPASPDSSPV